MIVLTDQIRVTAEYSGKSKFPFWKNLVVGDVLTIAMHLKPVGKYIPYLLVTNERTKEKFEDSLNSLQNYLYKTGHEEYRPSRTTPKKTLKDKLIDWLIDDGYSLEDATNDIEEAVITESGNRVTIVYANDVKDIVRINGDEVETIDINVK